MATLLWKALSPARFIFGRRVSVCLVVFAAGRRGADLDKGMKRDAIERTDLLSLY